MGDFVVFLGLKVWNSGNFVMLSGISRNANFTFVETTSEINPFSKFKTWNLIHTWQSFRGFESGIAIFTFVITLTFCFTRSKMFLFLRILFWASFTTLRCTVCIYRINSHTSLISFSYLLNLILIPSQSHSFKNKLLFFLGVPWVVHLV